MTTILPLVAAALLTGADAAEGATELVSMPEIVFMVERRGEKAVLRCAPDQSGAACADFEGIAIDVGDSVWTGLARRALHVMRRRDETSEGSTILFEPLAERNGGVWTIKVFDARSAQPGLQPVSAVWPADAGRPEGLQRLKYGVTTAIVGYEKKGGRVSRVFTSQFGFRQAVQGFDPARMVLAGTPFAR